MGTKPWADTKEKKKHLKAHHGTYEKHASKNKNGQVNVAMRNWLKDVYHIYRDTFNQEIGWGASQEDKDYNGGEVSIESFSKCLSLDILMFPKRIRVFLNNYSNKLGRVRGTKKEIAEIQEPDKKTRVSGLAPAEIYHKLFAINDPDKRLKAAFEEFCTSKGITGEDRRKQKMGHRKKFLKAEWDAASEGKQKR